MASLTDNFLGRRNRPGAGRPTLNTTPLAPPIQTKLDGLPALIAAQQAKCEQLALALIQGKIEQATLDTEVAALDALKAQERTLTAALAEAKRQDELARQARRGAQRAKEVAAVKQAVQDRDAAAKELASALDVAGKAYHRLLNANDAIRRNVPSGEQLRAPTEFAAATIQRYVAAETYRVSAVVQGVGIGRVLPGAASPDQLHKHNPDGIPRLVDVIAKSGAGIVHELSGSVEDAKAS
jgi:hypothetical protein